MTITEEGNLLTEQIGPKKKPEISLEWKDLIIEIKYCGNDIPDEVQEFVELFPNVSENLISTACIVEKKNEYNKNQKELLNSRPGSRIGHTLTQILEQNQMVNNKVRGEGSIVDSSTGAPSPPPASDISSLPAQGNDDEDNKSQKSEESDLPDDVDQQIDTKKLITLENGAKQCHICMKVFNDTTRIKRHLLSHSVKKPYRCHLCGWGFHQKCNMERHLASHTNEGEGHPCPRCNSWFTTKSVLSLHLKDAHNEKYIGKKEAASKIKKEEPEQEPDSYKALEIPFPEDSMVTKSIPMLEKTPTASIEQADLSNLTCHLCGKTFVKKTNLKHHLMLHRGEKPWKCHICGWRFVQKCNLKKHIETHVNGSYQCPQCDIKFASKGAVSGHMTIAHFKPGMNTTGNEPMEEEEETEIPAPEDMKKVDNEPKKASSPAMMWWKHLGDSVPGTNTKEEADENGKITSDNYQQFQTPSITITPKATLNIPKVTPTKISPTKTIAPKSEPIPKVIKCTKCPKTFLTKSDLEKHMLVHNAGMKPFACPVCGWRFHLLHNMKRHLVTHEESGDIEVGTADELLEAVEATATKQPSLTATGLGNISANVDGMISPISATSSLEQPEQAGVSVNSSGHMKCNLCNKWFTEAVALSRHMEVHSADRPFSCPICGWRFKQMHNMKRHMLTHSGAKPYSCDFCDKSYTDNYSLKQHVAKVHPDVASTLPHMMITPRTKKQQNTENQDHDGFKSMVNEMTASQKAAALQLYQQTLLAAQMQTEQMQAKQFQNEQLQTEQMQTEQLQAEQIEAEQIPPQQTPELPIGVEPVTYDEDNENDVSDDQEFDISQFMEEVNEEGELEIEDNLMSSELDVSHDENMEEIIEHPESNTMNVETENITKDQ